MFICKMLFCVHTYVLNASKLLLTTASPTRYAFYKKWTGAVQAFKYCCLPAQLIHQLHRKSSRDLSAWREAIRFRSNLQDLINFPKLWTDYKLSANIRYFASLSIVFHYSKGSYKHEQWDGFKNERTLMAVLYEAHSLLPLMDSVDKLSEKWRRNDKERKWSSSSTSEQLTQPSMVKKKNQQKQNKNRNSITKLHMIASIRSWAKPATELQHCINHDLKDSIIIV